MFIKHDYDWKELKQFIAPSNLPMYEMIEEEAMQDVFCLMVGDYFQYQAPTVEELNKYIDCHQEQIKQKIKEEWRK